MNIPPLLQAALGAALVGLGLSIMVAAGKRAALAPCEDCEQDALESIDDIAAASAEMNGSEE
jgi:hypothetical protein